MGSQAGQTFLKKKKKKKDFIYLFLETGEGRDRGRETSRAPLTGDLAGNPGMCPDQNGIVGLQDDVQPTEPQQSGQGQIFLTESSVLTLNYTLAIPALPQSVQVCLSSAGSIFLALNGACASEDISWHIRVRAGGRDRRLGKQVEKCPVGQENPQRMQDCGSNGKWPRGGKELGQGVGNCNPEGLLALGTKEATLGARPGSSNRVFSEGG